MLKRKLVAGSLMLSLVITTAPGSFKKVRPQRQPRI